ncbi:MAG: alanine--glyoxylate aminotransferase family protein [Opitutae bacterium]|nr:alanine--glyoxylate aminotransferase family protein [Opitutae bacterium]
MATKLYIPGPTEVLPEILAEMSRPMMGHRSKAASELQRRISNNLRRILLTENEILLSTSSGTGLMEGAVRSCTAKRAAIFSVGAFGKKWFKIARGNGVESDLIESEFGQPTTPEMVDAALSTGKYDTICVTHNETSTGVQNPVEEIAEVLKKYPDVVWCVDAVSSAAGAKIETDKLGIDVLVTSTQKALALPPGMAICTLSKKAYERTATVKNRGCYFDLRDIYDVIQKKDYQYTNTPCISIMFAMDVQLQRIMHEGVENRFKRHTEMAKFVRAWADEYFSVFANRNYLSNTLTVISNTRGISVAELNKKLQERGMQLGNGYGDLKEKTFRIAHMGELTLDDMRAITENIVDILKLK